MKVYVASKWEERPRVQAVMAYLRSFGHTITYDWTHCEQFSQEQAQRDVQGVMDADILIFIAEEDLPYKGAYVEFGIAVARGIPIYVTGNAIDQCIFTLLPNVHRGLPDLFRLIEEGGL